MNKLPLITLYLRSQNLSSNMKSNQTTIGIIGMGWVGSSVAISILQRGICGELLLNDANEEVAEGEAMDLIHGSSFYPTALVRASTKDEMRNCDAIVITAGRGGKPGESRLELLQDNIRIARRISDSLKGFKGLLIIVANPVDVLTYYYQQFTGLPKERVIGTGTMLDTARLREILGRKLEVDPKSIHASVLGEHGDSEVFMWSQARVGPLPLREWPEWNTSYEKDIARQVREAAQEIIKRKGATNHAIGLVTATLLRWILRGERRIVNVSSVMPEGHQYEGVAFSQPTLVGATGISEILEVKMDAQEQKRLDHSAQVLQEAIREAG